LRIPAEEVSVTTDGTRRTCVGYVLSTTRDWFEVLLDEQRTIHFVKTGAVSPFHPPLLNVRGAEAPRQRICAAVLRLGKPHDRVEFGHSASNRGVRGPGRC
jgi:hypothetical protein